MHIDDIDRLGIEPILSKTGPEMLDTDVVEARRVAACERTCAGVHGLSATHSVTSVRDDAAAMMVALQAVNIGARDGVVVSALSGPSAAGAVLDVNAVPVVIDIHPDTLTLDAGLTDDYLRHCSRNGLPLPKAIIVAHHNNRAAPMDLFIKIAKEWDLFLIEDCTPAYGGAWDGRRLGTIGMICILPGGFVVTADPTLDKRVRALANGGRPVTESAVDMNGGDGEVQFWREMVADRQLGIGPIQSGNNRPPAPVVSRLLSRLERFPHEYDRRCRALAGLDDRMRQAKDRCIKVLGDQPQVTSPVARAYSFGYKPHAFAGMDNALFRQVLSRLLSCTVGNIPYPLDRSPDYNPQTKRRYNLDPEHWSAIDPSRWDLPAAHEAFETVVTVGPDGLHLPSFADALPEAVDWMFDNAGWLVEQAA